MAKPLIKPRNPCAVPAARRKAGPHQKSEKALRRDANAALSTEAKPPRGKAGRPGKE